MNVLLTPIGSAGDNYPFIGLGRELARRGHRVRVLTGDPFAAAVRDNGMEFVSVGSEEEYRRAISDPAIWHPRKGLARVMELLGRQVDRLLDALPPLITPDTLVVAHTLDFVSRALAEKNGLPVVTVHLSPSVMRTLHDMPTMTGTWNPNRLPRWGKRLFWWLADKLMIDRFAGPLVNRVRQRIGLPPVRRVFVNALHSPRLTIGLWPDWFGAAQPDYPPFFRQTSFPLFDIAQPVPPQVARFLEAGPPPLVFTPGSANHHAHAFFQATVGACRALDRRGLLLTRHDQQVPADLPGGLAHAPFAPLSRILDRCAALVHHGGIGTTAAALAAGVPQIIMPMSHDQPDNAARVLRLGVGDRLLPRKFTADRLAATLLPLLDDRPTRERCRVLATRLAADDAIGRSVDLIEKAV